MKKLKPIIQLITILIFTSSCNSYKLNYYPTSYELMDRKSNVLEDLIKKDELFLIFTKGFENTTVKLLENNNIIFDSSMVTKKNGRAETLKVNINSNLKIYFADIKKPLFIKSSQMKLYKYVYIEKKKNKVTVEFNNGHKDLGSLPPNQ